MGGSLHRSATRRLSSLRGSWSTKKGPRRPERGGVRLPVACDLGKGGRLVAPLLPASRQEPGGSLALLPLRSESD